MYLIRCRFKAVVLLGSVFAALLACGNKSPTLAAPLGDRQVLQKLADAYEHIKQDLPVNPSGLVPMGKRKFVEQVFAESGYNYSATLSALAATEVKDLTPYHKDMRELLFLPHTGSRPTDMHAVYSDDELNVITRIDALFNSQR